MISSLSSTSQIYATSKVNKTAAVSAYSNVSETKPLSRMEQMEKKYKDVYIPIPEVYTKESEELQKAKIYEAYPNYISGPEFLKLVDDALEYKPIELGRKLTEEELDKQKLDYEQAYDKVYAIFGGEEAYSEMINGVKEIQNNYPVNHWGKDESIHNSKELARFTNATVYEGLEKGKPINEAKIEARSLMNSYMDVSFMADNFIETLKTAGISESGTSIIENDNFIDYKNPNNSVWDLREYGIDGKWQNHNIYENDKAMISDLEKELEQYSFLLNNKNLIEQENNKLIASNRGYFNVYEKDIIDNYLPNTNIALDIFKNYKIYDSIDVKA